MELEVGRSNGFALVVPAYTAENVELPALAAVESEITGLFRGYSGQNSPTNALFRSFMAWARAVEEMKTESCHTQ